MQPFAFACACAFHFSTVCYACSSKLSGLLETLPSFGPGGPEDCLVQDIVMHDASAHPSSSTSLNKLSQLKDFFKSTLSDWSRALSRQGFISLQVRSCWFSLLHFHRSFRIPGPLLQSQGSFLEVISIDMLCDQGIMSILVWCKSHCYSPLPEMILERLLVYNDCQAMK